MKIIFTLITIIILALSGCKIPEEALSPVNSNNNETIEKTKDNKDKSKVEEVEEKGTTIETTLPSQSSESLESSIESEEAIVSVPSTTNDNNTEEEEEPVIVADTTAPSISLNGVSTWQSTTATASATCSDNVGCNSNSIKYKYYTEASTCSTNYSEYTDSSSISEHRFVCATAKDTSGNAGFTSSTSEFKIDKTEPDSLTADKEGWYTSTDNITITSTDSVSGISWIKYKWDSNTACDSGETYTTPLIMQSGEHTLYLCSENNAGIQKTTFKVIGLDTSAPTDVTVSYTSGNYIVSSITITQTGTDSESGIKSNEVQYKMADLSGNSCGEYSDYETASITDNTFSAASGKCYKFRSYYTNNVDMTTYSSDGGEIKVDTSAPTGVVISYTSGYFNNNSFDVTLACSDTETGIATTTLQYMTATLSEGNCGTYGAWQDASSKLTGNTFTGDNGKCYWMKYTCENGMGVTSFATSPVIKIDSNAPTFSSLVTSGEEYNNYFTYTDNIFDVDITATESETYIEYMCLKENEICDDEDTWVAYESNTNYTLANVGANIIYVSLKDVAGNVSQLNKNVFYQHWESISNTSGPMARSDHSAIWTGSEMCVWGGYAVIDMSGVSLDTGNCYNPTTDTWREMSNTNGDGAPSERYKHKSVYTGSKMCVWGGETGPSDPGSCYDIASDSWSEMTTTGAPDDRRYFSSVWTGTKMCVWGGEDLSGTFRLDTGGCYNPTTNTWSTITTTDAPTARRYATAIWTGSKMCVWGGETDSGPTNDGYCYDPSGDQWTEMTNTNAPGIRERHVAVYDSTGNRMCIWGGYANGIGYKNDGGCYDFDTNTWGAIIATGAPTARRYATAIWTGERMCVWGGSDDSVFYKTGGCYDPDADNWTTISLTAGDGAPTKRYWHSSVWTGNKMCVWGGTFPYLDDGGCFNFKN